MVAKGLRSVMLGAVLVAATWVTPAEAGRWCQARWPRPVEAAKTAGAEPSKGNKELVGAQDYYFAAGRRIDLLRVPGEVVVGVTEGTDPDEAAERLTSANGVLEGFQRSRRFSRDTVVLVAAPGPAEEVDLERVAKVPAVAWVGPVFFDPETGTRLWATDEIVVALRPGVHPQEFFAQFRSYRRLRGTPDQYVVRVVGGGGVQVLAEANRLHSTPQARWAAPNFHQEFRKTAADPLLKDQWHLDNTGQTGAQADADVDAPDAWKKTKGSAVIAVLDDGVQTTHPDLADNIFVNSKEVADDGSDNDGNGWVDDVHGWDFYDNDKSPDPVDKDDNHGTAVAGVAAAVGENGVGGSGVCPKCKIMPLKISKGDSFADDATIAEAVYYAAGRTANGLWKWDGADVINMSWGGGVPDQVLIEAFDWAHDEGRWGLGVPLFAASGNEAAGAVEATFMGITSGTWVFEWRYVKDSSVSMHDDAAWLSQVELPDGTVQRFEEGGLPAGWLTGGNANWQTVAVDREHSGGHPYAARSGAITNSQTSWLRSPQVSVSLTGKLSLSGFMSSEPRYDKLELWAKQSPGSFVKQRIEWGGGCDPVPIGMPAGLGSTIAVGASTDWDYQANYSNYGPELDVVAPSSGGNAAITTTDRTGSAGYDPGNYTDSFGGTSSSTPLAAGIGALVLSANSRLTAQDVGDILRRTADKIGSLPYVDGFNEHYGYGRVNAAAAVAAATAWTPTPSPPPQPTPTRTPLVPEIACGETLSGVLEPCDADVFGDGTFADGYQLRLSAPSSVTATMSAQNFTSYLSIYEEDGQRRCAQKGAPVTCALSAGSYLLIANNNFVLSKGEYPYQLSLQCAMPTPTSTKTPTRTATATPTLTLTPTPTLMPCVGDCYCDGDVSISEIITCVNIALGNAPLSTCSACDPDGDGQVEIHELILAVTAAMDGCTWTPIRPTPTGPALVVDVVSTTPGQQDVPIGVSLFAGGAQVAGTQNTLTFDNTNVRLKLTSAGKPDCTVNPEINKGGTVFSLRPLGCTGAACTGVKTLVLALDNSDPIPSGSVLYTCRVDVASTANGTSVITISDVGLSTPTGVLVPGAVGVNGAIAVGGGSCVPALREAERDT